MCKLSRKHLALFVKKCTRRMYSASQKNKCLTCNHVKRNEKNILPLIDTILLIKNTSLFMHTECKHLNHWNFNFSGKMIKFYKLGKKLYHITCNIYWDILHCFNTQCSSYLPVSIDSFSTYLAVTGFPSNTSFPQIYWVGPFVSQRSCMHITQVRVSLQDKHLSCTTWMR